MRYGWPKFNIYVSKKGYKDRLFLSFHVGDRMGWFNTTEGWPYFHYWNAKRKAPRTLVLVYFYAFFLTHLWG